MSESALGAIGRSIGNRHLNEHWPRLALTISISKKQETPIDQEKEKFSMSRNAEEPIQSTFDKIEAF